MNEQVIRCGLLTGRFLACNKFHLIDSQTHDLLLGSGEELPPVVFFMKGTALEVLSLVIEVYFTL